jgi:hypothetical protein
MSPARTDLNWKKWGTIFACLVAAWQLGTYIYNGIENSKEATIRAASEAAIRRANRYADSVKVELRLRDLERRVSYDWCDSVKDDLHDLNKKNHITDKF